MNRRNRPAEPSNEPAFPAAPTSPSRSPSYYRQNTEGESFTNIVGPNMTVEQENGFASQTLLMLALIPGAAVIVVQMLLDEWLLATIHSGNDCLKNLNKDDTYEAANSISRSGMFIFFSILIALFLIPKRLLRTPAVSAVAYIALLIGFICSAYYFNNAYKVGLSEREQKHQAKLMTKLGTTEADEKREIIQACSMIRKEVGNHIWFSHITLSVGLLVNSMLSHVGFMNIRFLAMVTMVGVATGWTISGSYGNALYLNSLLCIFALVFPFLWALRLQQWMSGRVPSSLKMTQIMPAAVCLIADMPMTILDALNN